MVFGDELRGIASNSCLAGRFSKPGTGLAALPAPAAFRRPDEIAGG